MPRPTTLVAACCVAAAAGFTAYQALEPVGALDIATVLGDNLASADIFVCWSPNNCSAVTPLAPTANAVKFAIPAPPAGPASTFQILLNSSDTQVVLSIGQPSVEWFYSDSAAAAGQAVIGSHLYLLGRNLGIAGASGVCLPFSKQSSPVAWNTTVLAVPAGSAGPFIPGAIVLPPPSDAAAVRSCYRIDAVVPSGTPVGSYDVYVLNGLQGVNVSRPAIANVSFVPAYSFPSTTLTLGSSPGCSTVPACMATLTAAGGGVLSVPAGTWYMASQSQILFPCSAPIAIIGAGRDASNIQWPVGTQLIANTNPVTWNVSSSSNSSCSPWLVQDITIALYAAPSPGAQPVLGMDVVHIPGSTGPGRFIRSRIVNDLSAYPGIQVGSAFSATTASFFALLDVNIVHSGSCTSQWPHNTAVDISEACTDFALRALNVTTTCPGYSIAASSRFMMTDGVWTSIGPVSEGQGLNTLSEPAVMENAYMGNVSFVGCPSAPERWESMTYDGPGGAFNGTALSSGVVNPDGTQTIPLATPLTCRPWGSAPCLPAGQAVAIMRGTGTGQMRRLVDANTTSITIDAPFEPAAVPGDSYISVTGYKGSGIFEGNSFVNGTVFQFYGGAVDTIIAGNNFTEMFDTVAFNRTNVAAGIRLFGHRYVYGYEANWRNLVLQNDAQCVTQFIAYSDVINNITFSLGHVFRGNAISGGVDLALNYVWDPVVQGNTFADAYCVYAGETLPAGQVSINATCPGAVVLP